MPLICLSVFFGILIKVANIVKNNIFLWDFAHKLSLIVKKKERVSESNMRPTNQNKGIINFLLIFLFYL